MRIFLAIEIPPDIRERLVEIQEQLKPQIPGVRWEKPEKFHITLIFLGRVNDERLGELEEAVRKGVKGIKGFKVGLSGVGFFPRGRRPRVVLIGVGEGGERLLRLQKRLGETLSKTGFAVSKKKPHVTLGRFSRHIQASPSLRDGTIRETATQLKAGSILNVAGFEVKEIAIVESRLHPAGAIHTPITRIPLMKS